jgi:hypothetical protein
VQVVVVTALAALLAIGSIVILPIPTTAGAVRPSRDDGVRSVSRDARDVDVIETVPTP